MRVVVTGATGFVGKGLVHGLHSAGHQLVVFSRSAERARESLKLPVTYGEWDGTQGEPNLALLTGAEVVIHLAGENVAQGRWTKKRKRELCESRVLASRNLISALQKLSTKPRVVISASAVGFYGDRGDEILSESSQAGEGFLSQLCVDWEDAILRPELPGVRRVVLRTGIVLGREGGVVAELKPVFEKRLASPLGTGKQWVSWIHLEDLHQLYLRAMNDKTVSGVIDAVSPNPVTNREFTEAFAAQLGVGTLFSVPKFALELTLGEKAEIVLSSQRVKPVRALAMEFAYAYPEIHGALKQCLTKTQS